MTSADANGDGKSDLIASTTSPSLGVNVLLGNGDGSFGLPSFSSTSVNANNISFGDFDGDGKLDLALRGNNIGNSDTLSIVLGNGDGTYKAPVSTFIAGTSSIPRSLSVGDFNGDGKLDLFLSHAQFGTSTTLMLGNGDGTFSSTLLNLNPGSVVLSSIVADFNGDSKLDIAAEEGASIEIFLGNGNGTFQAGKINNSLSDAFAVGDVNGDGKPDLVLTTNTYSTRNLTVLLGIGDGTFQTANSTPFDSGVATLGDYNGDGHLDLAATTIAGSQFTVLLGNGDGSFGPAVDYNSNSLLSLTSGDFNADGYSDIAIGTSNNGGSVLLALAPPLSLNPSSAAIPASTTSLTITGQGFSIIPSRNLVQFNNGTTGTVTASTSTSITVTGLSGLIAGNLTAVVTINGVASGTPVQVATVTPVVTTASAPLPANSTTLTISGYGFSPIAANNSVTFNNGVTGTIAAATTNSLTITGLTGLITGSLTAAVTIFGFTSTTVQIASVTPVVTSNTANLPAGATSLVIQGFGFSATPGNNTVSFNNGASGTVSAATSTSLTITGLAGLVPGNLTAVITTNGVSSGTAVQVGTVQASVQFSVASESINPATGQFTITVQLSSALASNVVIPFTLGGTAVSGVDYSGVTASPITIPAGGLSANITGTLIVNNSAAGYPTLTFTLGTPTNAALGSVNVNTLTILDPIATLNVGGLRFIPSGTFTTNGSISTTTNPVQVGFDPGAGVFVPLLTLQGTVTVDAATSTLTNTGVINAATGGSSAVLFTTGFSGASIAALIGTGITGLSGVPMSINGLSFTPTKLALNSAGTNGAEVALQGGLTLPYGITAGVTASNQVILDSAGMRLTGVDASITSSSFSLGSVTFTNTTLTVQYNSAANQLTLRGTTTATLTQPGGNAVLQLNFGGGGTTGIQFNSGSLVVFDASVTGSFTVGSVNVSAQALTFAYSTVASTFSMQGTASASIGGMGNLSLTLGYQTNPGLVVTNGALTRFDATLNSNIVVAGVTFNTTGLEFLYTASNNQFSLTGSVSSSVTGLGTMSLAFGFNGQPGLVVTAGALTKLDFTFNSNITVAGVVFTTRNLEFIYTASTSQFSITGATTATIGRLGAVSVLFGFGGNPGLVVTGGALTQLDLTLNSDISVSGSTFTTTGLEFLYTASNNQFSLFGAAATTIAGLGTIQVAFGFGSNPGLVITNGSLSTLDLTLNSNITVGTLTFTTQNLEFLYSAANNQFALLGSATTTITGIGTVMVTFSFNGQPGIVITNGSLTTLDVTLNSNINVNKVNITTQNLEFRYDSAPNKFALFGLASVSVAGINNFQVIFGQGGKPGLVIQNGALESMDVIVSSNLVIDGVTFTVQNLEFIYTAINSTFTLSGTAIVSLPVVGQVTVTFGHNGNPGLVITNATLVSLDMTVNANFTTSGVSFNAVNMEFTYTDANHTFTMTGLASATFGVGSVLFQFGDATSRGIIVTNGTLTNFDASSSSRFGVAGLSLGVANSHLTYDAASGTFDLKLNVGVGLMFTLPTALQKLIDFAEISLNFGAIDVNIHVVAGNNSASFTSFSVTIADYTIGISVDFNGNPTFIGLPDLQTLIVKGLVSFRNLLVNQARDVGQKILDGLTTAGNAVSDFFVNTIDNELSGATVFYDANGNGILDSREPSTITGSDGAFQLSVLKTTTGQFAMSGGINIGTNLPNTTVYLAPADSRTISPLTTLVQTLRATHPELSELQAIQLVSLGLGIPDTIDLRIDNFVTETLTGNRDAQKEFSAAVQVAGILEFLHSALKHSTTLSATAIDQAIFNQLNQLFLNATDTVRLSDPNVLSVLINAVAVQIGATVTPGIVSGLATVLAGINNYIASAAGAGTEYETSVVHAQVAAGKNIVPVLPQVVSAAIPVDSFVAAHTGSAFAVEASTSQIGVLAAPTANFSHLYATSAGPGGGPRVQVYDRQTGVKMFDFFVFEPSFTGGVTVSMGDVNGDGIPDLAVGALEGGGPRVRVFDGSRLGTMETQGSAASSAVLADFFAFDPSFRGGVSLALAHLDDGFGLNLVVGAGVGGGPRVRTFRLAPNGEGVAQVSGGVGDFFAFDPNGRFGVNVAAGDIYSLNRDQIIVGAGVGGAPIVAIFDSLGNLIHEFAAFDVNSRGGISVAAGYVLGTVVPQIIAGSGVGLSPEVGVFDAAGTKQKSFPVFDPQFLGGVRVNVGPSSSGQQLVATAGEGGGPRVTRFNNDLSIVSDMFVLEPAFLGGVLVG